MGAAFIVLCLLLQAQPRSHTLLKWPEAFVYLEDTSDAGGDVATLRTARGLAAPAKADSSGRSSACKDCSTA